MKQGQSNVEIMKRIEKLEAVVFGPKKTVAKLSKSAGLAFDLDFGINNRAFVKKYSKRLSGPKKFILILSYLAKGQTKTEVSIDKIKKDWGKMKSLFGGEFNAFYSTTAKDNNWANSEKHGLWFLTKDWKNIFS